MFHAAALLLELESSSDQERVDEQTAAGDLFPRIYYTASRSANHKHAALLCNQAFSTWAVNLCMFQQYSQLSVQHHYVLRNEIIPQDVCGCERSPHTGVLMATVGRSDRYRIWCAHQKSQSRCHSNNAATAWAGGSQGCNFWHLLWLFSRPLCVDREKLILVVSLIHGGGPE